MMDIDFIPEAYHKARRARRAQRLHAAFCSALVLAMVMWVAVHHHRLAEAKAMQSDLAMQQQQIEQHRLEKEKLMLRQARLLDRRQTIELIRDPISQVVVFGDLSRRLPGAASVTGLTVESPWLSMFVRPSGEHKPGNFQSHELDENELQAGAEKPRFATLSVRGLARSAPDVIDFAASMESSPLFENVLTELQSGADWNGRKAEGFELTCRMMPQSQTAVAPAATGGADQGPAAAASNGDPS